MKRPLSFTFSSPFFFPLFLCVLASLLLFACKKDSFITSRDARISITIDTLKYDTVFTKLGSVTQSFKIINENNQKLRLSSVKLMGGNSSAYKINIDGVATEEAKDVELEANDSVYVFVQVTVDPNSQNLPFVIRDSIQVAYNGNTQFVQLEAWGQNAHFFRDKHIISDEAWTNDLPYVIQGFLFIEAGKKLTIEKGCRIYLHADAPVIVDGTLIVNGEKDTADRVYFTGDRLDEPYEGFPAAWPGIYFSPLSKDNVLQYAVIKNAYQALSLEAPSSNASPKLLLKECVIDNAYDAGILALNSSIVAENCLISNCGKNISITGGGDYQFTHCTAVTYSNAYIDHKSPVLFLSNAANTGTGSLQAIFRNCIFWGEGGLVDDEVIVNRSGANPFSVNFDYNLWKVKTAPANVTVNHIINGQPPLFDSINVSNRYFNFRLKEFSPAIDAGTPSSVLIDLDGKNRPVGLPDLGCFEK